MVAEKIIGNKRPLALYVHIPFCVKKCNYCDFLSGPANKQRKEEYITALLHEIRSYQSFAKEYEVKTIFIGGGTPSSIEADAIVHIIDALQEVFAFTKQQMRQMEVSIEINPGTVDREKLYTYYNAGINRVSFGLQSANDEELKLLGRIHTFEEFIDNYNMARKTGFSNINIDLMSALPGQTIESYEATLSKIMTLQPEHISAYSLIIEEGTPFYDWYGEDSKKNEYPELPTEEDERKMYEITKAMLSARGYERYEISNYSKKGYECKHNCTYWQRGEYLGLGNGAASLIKEKRFTNPSDLDEYINRINYTIRDEQLYHDNLHCDVELLNENARMEEFMFLGLRMMKGISIQKFYTTFGQDIHKVYGNVINKFKNDKLLKEMNGRISLTEHGIDVSNFVMSEFLLED